MVHASTLRLCVRPRLGLEAQEAAEAAVSTARRMRLGPEAQEAAEAMGLAER